MKNKFGLGVIKMIVVLAMVLPLCLGVLAGCTDKDPEAGPRARIKNLTEIEVPTDAEMVFHYQEEVFFPVPGRRAQYTVFEFENEPSEWLNENGFSKERDSDYESYFMSSDFGLLNMTSLEIPNDYIPDFEKPYFWFQKHRVYFAYLPEQQYLVIFVKPS